jgi:hypothetical protein
MLYSMKPVLFSDSPDGQPNRRRGGRLRCQDLRCDLGQILDISSTGMRVAVGRRPAAEEGSVLPVVFSTPDGTVKLWTRVARCKRHDSSRRELGLEFVDPTPEQLQLLRSMARGIAINDTGRWSRGV